MWISKSVLQTIRLFYEMCRRNVFESDSYSKKKNNMIQTVIVCTSDNEYCEYLEVTPPRRRYSRNVVIYTLYNRHFITSKTYSKDLYVCFGRTHFRYIAGCACSSRPFSILCIGQITYILLLFCVYVQKMYIELLCLVFIVYFYKKKKIQKSFIWQSPTLFCNPMKYFLQILRLFIATIFIPPKHLVN